MEREEFVFLRKKLNKTQKEIAQLLGISLKAVHSYEQGWRSIPGHAERQLLFPVFRAVNLKRQKCWQIKKCPVRQRRECPAWEFKAGDLCWFIAGTICQGVAFKSWKEKMAVCRSCEVFLALKRSISDE